MDVRTMAIMGALVSVLLAVLLYAQYRFNRGYSGVGWWAAGQAAIAAGFLVSAARGDSVLGRIAVPAYQALLMLGTVLIYVGVQRFLDRRERRLWLIAVWVALVAWSTFHTFVVDDAKLRSIGLYLMLALVLGATGFVLWRHRLPSVRGTAAFLAVVFAASAASYLVLAVSEWARTVPNDPFYAPSPVNAGAFITATIGMLLWTFGLIIMINQRLEAAVTQDARNMHSVFATGPDSSIISRLSDGTIDDVNEGFTRLTGYTREEVLGQSAVSLGLWVNPQQRTQLLAALSTAGSVTDFSFDMRRKDGSTVQCLLAASTLNLDGVPYLITVTRDVTQQRRMEAELLHEATTDSLTGLPNRRHFLSVCERELSRARRSGGTLAVAVIDIDHFKDINDTHGHAAGDAAIIDFAATVSATIRDVDTLGRLGGDEFGLLLPDADLERALAAVERVRETLEAASHAIDGHDVPMTLSAGVAVIHDPEDQIDALLGRADRALYDAKEQGRNRVVGER